MISLGLLNLLGLLTFYSVFNWEEGSKISSFYNNNPVGSKISSLSFVNEDDLALLAVASGIKKYVGIIFI